MDFLAFPSVNFFKTLHSLRYKRYLYNISVFEENLSEQFSLMAKNKKSRETHVAFGCFRRYSFIIFNNSFTITKIVQ